MSSRANHYFIHATPRYLVEIKKRIPICSACGEHQALHAHGKCLFHPSVFTRMTKKAFLARIKVNGVWRRFYDSAERRGGGRCGSCQAGSFFVQSNSDKARVTQCLNCTLRVGRVCKHCWLTRAEHWKSKCIFGPQSFERATRRKSHPTIP